MTDLNLFFRVSNLIQKGVKLVFVVDGEPPDLKLETIQRLQNARCPGASMAGSGKVGRSHFQSILEECQELLDTMGVPYLQSRGEAEAFAALLNKQGLVDGVMTEDGDVFLYGATKVYKNFKVKSPVTDCYIMKDIEEELKIDRRGLVALALLLGCDYLPKGVPGVGKVQAMKFLNQMVGANVLERLQGWKDLEVAVMPRPPHCSKCLHVGSSREHKQKGCPLCDGICPTKRNINECNCAWHQAQMKMEHSSVESELMKKAQTVKDFPRTDIIKEYLDPKDECPPQIKSHSRPEVLKFESFAVKKLGWSRKYAREKILPITIYYDLTCQSSSSSSVNKDRLVPLSVVKRKVQNFVQCLEIEWTLPDKWKLEGDKTATINTIERLDLFEMAYPEMVQRFNEEEEAKKNKKAKKSRSTKSKTTEPETTHMVDESVKAPKRAKKN